MVEDGQLFAITESCEPLGAPSPSSAARILAKLGLGVPSGSCAFCLGALDGDAEF